MFDLFKDVIILINSLDIINVVLVLKNINLIIIGNNYKRKICFFVGMDDLVMFDKYNINKVFMFVIGMMLIYGLINLDLLEYEIKKRILEKVKEVYLLVDYFKFGKLMLLMYVLFDRLYCIVIF